MVTKREATKGAQSKPAATAASDFWEKLAEISRGIPAEELAKVPRDMSKNIDHYLYGFPKDEE